MWQLSPKSPLPKNRTFGTLKKSLAKEKLNPNKKQPPHKQPILSSAEQ
jgi:hypothetical protein